MPNALGNPFPEPIEFNRWFASNAGFETTLQTLRDAISDAEMMVLHEIDTQAILKKGGIEIGGLRQILYFHPRYMKQVLETDASAVIEAPLKFVVRESGENQVVCNYIRPSYLFGRYAGLEKMGAELDGIAVKIAASVG